MAAHPHLRKIRHQLGRLVGLGALESKVDGLSVQLRSLVEAHEETAMTAGHGLAVAGDAAHGAGVATSMARTALDGSEQVPSILDALHDHDQRLTAGERLASIIRTMTWVQLTEPDPAVSELSISVVTPTYNRAERLQRAVGSVVAQSHPRWELLIGDDGSDDDTAKVIESLRDGDDRIRGFRYDHAGSCAARNRLLDAATGDVVVYLDDDNLMAPGWLRSVAWCFAGRPDVEVAYGARLVDNPERLWGGEHAGSTLPSIQFEPYDRGALERGNVVDVGCLAHRRELAGAGFDAQLDRLADWDLVLRLTADRRPFELPALAICYFTDADDRVSAVADHDAEEAIIRAKLARPSSGA